MLTFRISYSYKAPTVTNPTAVVHGAKEVKAEDEDDARFVLTGLHSLKNAKGLTIKSVEAV